MSTSHGPDIELTDVVLIRRVIQRDESALSTLYDRYARLVYSVALRVLQDPSTAEEVVQDIFHQVWRNASAFDPARGSLSGWLLVSARNRSIDRLRRRRTTDEELRPETIACSTNIETAASQNELMSIVKQHMVELPGNQRAGAPEFLRWLVPMLAAAALALLVLAAQLKTDNRALTAKQTDLEAEVQKLERESVREHAVLEILTASDSVRVTLVSGTAHPVPEGRAFYNSCKGLLFYASHLPELTADRTYQLWLVPTQGNPISAGVFQVDAAGNGLVTLPEMPPNVTAKAFAVTIEPSGGVPQPTGPKVLIGLVS